MSDTTEQVTRSQFDNVCDCRQSTEDGIMCAYDVMIGGIWFAETTMTTRVAPSFSEVRMLV